MKLSTIGHFGLVVGLSDGASARHFLEYIVIFLVHCCRIINSNFSQERARELVLPLTRKRIAYILRVLFYFYFKNHGY